MLSSKLVKDTTLKSFSLTPHSIVDGDACFALLKVRIGHIHPEM
jgi:hypothetical protein